MKTPAKTTILTFLMLALGLFAGAGCSTVRVQPWERAALSDYAMRPDRDPLAGVSTDHTYFSREAAHGGRGVGGSGCGCN
ncbi:MAG TPA: DUF4266 domain-containing protein [Opitutus sp.]|nr:DUF4266 domain-containing protein [Opitutus sp.]